MCHVVSCTIFLVICHFLNPSTCDRLGRRSRNSTTNQDPKTRFWRPNLSSKVWLCLHALKNKKFRPTASISEWCLAIECCFALLAEHRGVFQHLPILEVAKEYSGMLELLKSNLLNKTRDVESWNVETAHGNLNQVRENLLIGWSENYSAHVSYCIDIYVIISYLTYHIIISFPLYIYALCLHVYATLRPSATYPLSRIPAFFGNQ